MNPLLSEADQGRSYVIKAFVIRPEVTILSAGGKVDRRYIGKELALHEAQFGDTLPAFMERLGLKMEASGGE
jgi:hypothetical protein